MSKKLILIVVVCILIFTACSKNYKVDINDSLVVAMEKNKTLYLQVNNLEGKEKRSIRICKTKEDLAVPVRFFRVDNTQILIFVGNNNGNPVEVYKYKSKEGSIENLGEMDMDNTDCLIVNDKIYCYKYNTNNDNKYWINVYSLSDLKNPVQKINVPYAPKKMIYSDTEHAIYFLLVGDVKTSQLGKYSLDNDKMNTILVDKDSFAGDIVINDEKIYLSMMGYSDENNEVENDNRILIYNKDLEYESGITTKSNAPCLLAINDNNINVTVEEEGSRLEVISLSNTTEVEQIFIDSTRQPLGIEHKNSTTYVLGRDQIYIINNNNVDSISTEGENISFDIFD
jgi:hypothetical protein